MFAGIDQKAKWLIGGLAATILAVFLVMVAFEDVDAGEIVVIQEPFTGDLTVVSEPGWAWRGAGRVTTYPKRNEFKFGGGTKGDHDSPPLPIRFYDGGNGTLAGSISWMMPTDPASVIKLHREFRSSSAIEMQAIRRSMEAAATSTGPTMTSMESAAGRRGDLISHLNDQTLHGVYRTVSRTVRAKDVAGVERDMSVLEIVRDPKGQPERAQASYVEAYKVTLLPLTISQIKYDERIEAMIAEQQKATNAAVVAKANADKAAQDAITLEAQGRAAATKTKWDQEQLNAKTIAEAEAKVKIANASVAEAELYKKATILRAEGEAEAKRRIMEADGALAQKLATFEKVNLAYADAIKEAQPGAWTPSVQMGNTGGGQGAGGAAALVDMLIGKTAKDLALDLGVRGSKK